MVEACDCGRNGGFEDRTVAVDGEGREILACRYCGHIDDLGWLSDENRRERTESVA